MNINPRKPLVAALMSLVLPGFGQLYNGQVNKAIWLFLLFALISVPGIALIALALPAGAMLPALLLGVALALGLWLFAITDAWRGARALGQYRAAAWQLSGVYALVFILCNGLALPLLIDYVRTHKVQAFRIPGTSMEPTVLHGDYIFADKRYNCPGCRQGVRRGDIAVFSNPNDRTVHYIKRIIGLPGDRIDISGSSIRVNEVALATDAASGGEGGPRTEGDGKREWQAPETAETRLIVPAGHVFVLGDNRDASQDSRHFDTVPLQDVVGRARQVWFSIAEDGVRWSRLGRVLQ